MPLTIVVTGGAGFIGSAVVRRLIGTTDARVVNVDKLTYAGNLASFAEAAGDPRHRFEQVDITDAGEVRRIFDSYDPDAVIHLAAETHVDRSIDSAEAFVRTNVVGTFVLLEQARAHWERLPADRRDRFRFLHVSTDEVFGSIDPARHASETSAYHPSSPYSATKAGSDHLVRAWHRTYGLPILIATSSNNYGPYQFPEKLIPLVLINALEGASLPVYGDGGQVRDWLFVEDHATALVEILGRGSVGESYAVSGDGGRRNNQVVGALCALLDELAPRTGGLSYAELIEHVADRPGHDVRYALDSSRLRDGLGWRPAETFETGLRKTVEWYLANRSWWERIRSSEYRGERLGRGTRPPA